MITFQPGDIGITVQSGLVSEVHKRGQGESLGVREGWVLLTVGGEPYSRRLLHAACAEVEPYSVTFRRRKLGRTQMHYNNAMNAHNVWTLAVNEEVVDEAARIFTEEILPEFLSAMQAGMEGKVVCPFTTVNGSNFVVTPADGWSSDIAWISVNDEETYRRFEHLFHRSGVADYFKPLVEHDHGLRLFGIQFIVRSFARGPHMHVDYIKEVGTDCLTLMTPLTPKPKSHSGLNLLYESIDGEVNTYTYRHGQAVVFGSNFRHSTEPGQSGERMAFLGLFFGTDRQESWPYIARTIGRQQRILRMPNGQFELTWLNDMIEVSDALIGAMKNLS